MICDRIGKAIIILIFFSFLSSMAESKVYSKNIPIVNYRRENGWLFIDRATINSGYLEIHLAIKLIAQDYKIGSQFTFVFSALPSELWEAESTHKCDTSKFTNEQL